MSAATFYPPSLSVANLYVDDSLAVQQDVSVGNDVTVAGLVSAGDVAASTVTATGNIRSSGGQVRGATVRSDGQLTVAAGGMSIEGTILQNSGNMTCSAGTVSGLAVNGGTCDISGAAEFGSNGADTFKVHGTSGDGLQQAFVASPASPGAVYSEAEADAVRDAVVSCLDALKRHGFMATS